MKSTLCAAVGLAIAAASAAAETTVYDFADPKGVNAIQFLLDSPLEPIAGMADGVKGTITVDRGDVTRSRGRIEVEVASIEFANPRMAEVLRSPAWLDAAAHPLIWFEIDEVTGAERLEGDAEDYRVAVKGRFHCRGVTRPLEAEGRVTHLPGALGDRVKGATGDLLVLRTAFVIRRVDFGIKPDLGFTSVANDIEVRAALVGQAPAPAP